MDRFELIGWIIFVPALAGAFATIQFDRPAWETNALLGICFATAIPLMIVTLRRIIRDIW